jgi:hypothetical protein
MGDLKKLIAVRRAMTTPHPAQEMVCCRHVEFSSFSGLGSSVWLRYMICKDHITLEIHDRMSLAMH